MLGRNVLNNIYHYKGKDELLLSIYMYIHIMEEINSLNFLEEDKNSSHAQKEDYISTQQHVPSVMIGVP